MEQSTLHKLAITFSVVSMALTLVVAELGLRAWGGLGRVIHEPRPDRAWLYGMRPGAERTLRISGDTVYRINEDGFRDRVYVRPKPEGVFRVLVLGDSVAFGFGVEERESFPKRMEEQLAEALAGPTALRVEVLNLGVSGYNPYTELAQLEDVGPSYAPDLVLVQFSINDLNDPTLHFDVQTRLHLGTIPDAAYPDPAARRAPAEPPGPVLRACRRFRVCALLDDVALALMAKKPEPAENRAAAVPIEGDAGPEWPWLENLYGRMSKVSEAMGARFAVLAFPYQRQLRGVGPHPVAQRLVAMGKRRGWLTVNPLKRFRASHRAKVKLFRDWWHPTAVGHRVAARETVSALACADLLSEAARKLCRPR